MVSSPGMDGKPRKFTPLPNLAPQVANCLSQPAWMKNPSPVLIARTGASISVIWALPAEMAWIETSARRPAFAPLVYSTRPSANQFRAKPPRPEVVKLRSPESAATDPLAV